MNGLGQLIDSWEEERPGVAEAVLSDTLQLIGVELPDDLLTFVRTRNGGAATLAKTAGQTDQAWIRLDPVEDWAVNSDSYGFSPQKFVMIGSDGGAFAYCLSVKSLPMEYRQIDFVGGGKGDYLGDTFEQFLTSVRDNVTLKAPKRPKPAAKPKKVEGPAKDKPLRELKGSSSAVTAMALSPDGSRLVTTCAGGEALVFDLATGKASPARPRGEDVNNLAAVGWIGNRAAMMQVYSPRTGQKGIEYFLRITDVASGEVISTWSYGQYPGSNGRGLFSPDGTRLVHFEPHLTQFFVDPATGNTIKPLPSASNHPFAMAWSRDSRLLALGRRSTITPPGYVFAEHGNMSPAQPDWSVWVIDRDGNEVTQLKIKLSDNPYLAAQQKDSPGVRGVDFSRAGDSLLVAGADVRIYPLSASGLSSEPTATFKVPMRTIETACFVENDRVAVTTWEGAIVLFDIATQKAIRTWNTTKLQCRLLLATPDGRFILTANGSEMYSAPQAESKTIRVWEVDR